MESGKWKVENGKWKMENGKWKAESGKRKFKNAKWKVMKLIGSTHNFAQKPLSLGRGV